MKKIISLIFACMLLFCMTAVQAEQFHHATVSPTPVPYGNVAGTVTDAYSSSPLQGVTVTVGTVTVTTDANGAYSIELAPGEYTLTFEKEGFGTETADVTIAPAMETTKDVALSGGALVSGYVCDATDPTIFLADVTVSCGSVSTVSDASGRYSLFLPSGEHTITFVKENFVEASKTVSVSAGTDTEQDAFLSGVLASNEYRVVLTWGAIPSDLDSHLKGETENGTDYHIYFNKKEKSGQAQLDVDDTSSYGPETVTFTAHADRNYVFYIHDYSNRANRTSKKMSNSSAKIEVFRGETHLMTFSITPDNAGIYWEVFRVENGQFIEVDSIRSNEP
ncbi:MAG: hypothetical protein E7331_00700 [Clostridiales bacterium]|nr:hypothetical protein [Clostridiales bacterium]